MNNKKYIKPKATVINIESQSILTSSPYPDFLQTEVLEVDDTEQDNLSAY